MPTTINVVVQVQECKDHTLFMAINIGEKKFSNRVAMTSSVESLLQSMFRDVGLDKYMGEIQKITASLPKRGVFARTHRFAITTP